MATSEPRARPKLKNSLFFSLLEENLAVETGLTATASATNVFNSFLHLAALRLLDCGFKKEKQNQSVEKILRGERWRRSLPVRSWRQLRASIRAFGL
jgi:hypothetical protein